MSINPADTLFTPIAAIASLLASDPVDGFPLLLALAYFFAIFLEKLTGQKKKTQKHAE